MNILFFDTETTGLVDFKAPFDAEHQPSLIQLGAILSNENGVEYGSLDLLISTQVSIPEEASNVHGITKELVDRFGIDLNQACVAFLALVRNADLLVCHNVSYDLVIMQKAFVDADMRDFLFNLDKKNLCTMRKMTNICCLPGTRGYKWPKLAEAYKFCFNKELENAHSAIVDVRACKEIFFWMLSCGKLQL